MALNIIPKPHPHHQSAGTLKDFLTPLPPCSKINETEMNTEAMRSLRENYLYYFCNLRRMSHNEATFLLSFFLDFIFFNAKQIYV